MLQSKENEKVPNVSFRLRDGDSWVERSTEDIFKNKKVVIFSLPGAYTPTCSSSHLPRYEQFLNFKLISRRSSASPASGYASVHKDEQEKIVQLCFN